jgi:hypothetical protein
LNDELTDFTTQLPSRRAGPPEYAGLTPEAIQAAERRKLLGEPPWEPDLSKWLAAAPSEPAVLRLLDFEHAQSGQPLPPRRPVEPFPPGPNATDEEVAAYQGRRHRQLEQYQLADETFMARFRFWAGLDPCRKSQLAADLQNRQQPAGTPAWAVSCATDGEQPPLVILASDAAAAIKVYRHLTGITSCAPLPDGTEGIVAAPYVPACSANGNGNGNGHIAEERP